MRGHLPVPTLFSELGISHASTDQADFAATCGAYLERAARVGDLEACRKGVEVVLWLDQQATSEERFAYVCQDVLRRVIQSSSLRGVFASALNGRAFNQLKGYIEYLSSSEVVREMSSHINSTKRGS